ncbi:tRNA(Met) cytidine acetyltransferase TmcA [Thiomicrorhabdus cannonii]|uniref:tRNA(Met) cytidine acetyltransferase TmcA n=1 Tax=Thiomicrorhabdus cannonii TaxID=2748011 RepID=UPI0015C1242B|nr:GNAT family N-acetyltransferase [Thiomicrorhabdus cannonii]
MISFDSLTALRQTLKQRQHRALVILSGETGWQHGWLTSLWSATERVIQIGEADLSSGHEIEQIDSGRLLHHLGGEADGIIIDVSHGLSANSLGIAAGMLRAGGLFILLTPPTERWRTQSNPENSRFLNSPLQPEHAFNHFTEHLIRQWQNPDAHVVWLSQGENESILLAHEKPTSSQSIALPTPDQQHAIDAIDTVAFGHRKRPLVISADRGRGKSSALGLAAVHCLLKGKQQIVITAARFEQAQIAFTQAEKQLESLPVEWQHRKPGLLSFDYQGATKTLTFMAPDQLVLEPTEADLLMVDEAAHLPAPLLTELLKRHHRMVFATTLHGYEGSGRGFELRFKQTLDDLTPDWKALHLQQPIRWAENDPLEHAINRALLLETAPNKAAVPAPLTQADSSQLHIRTVSSAQLLHHPDLLESVFSLLVQAHYQTSPNDLQQLLNAPNLHILVAEHQGEVVGVVVSVAEGKMPPRSNRSHERVHGHLVPQLLTKHYATTDFMLLSTWRVMRIAVHPARQRQGIGRRLLQHLAESARAARIDYLSSSFGADETLLPFWCSLGYQPLHIGVKRDKASGHYNAVVAQALSSMAQQALAAIHRHFQSQFPHTLMESLPYLSATLILGILQSFRFKTREPQLEASLRDYLHDQRGYESISAQLWEWSLRHPHKIKQLSKAQQAVWCDKMLKKHGWPQVAHDHHLAGRKGVEEQLKASIETLLRA